MSAPTVPHDYVGDQKPQPAAKRAPHPVYKAVQALASLRLTVVLFSLGLFLVLFGTLGMTQDSIEGVVEKNFRCWLAWIDFRGLATFGKIFVGMDKNFDLPIKLPFPGGYTIGWLMFINLLAAHAVRFKLTWKRSGIFLLHAGVIVLLAGEFLTGQMAVETRMRITEGGSARYAASWSYFEVAVIDPSDPDMDQVVVVPRSMIEGAKRTDWVSHPDVPFEIQRVESYDNARLRGLKPGEVPVADRGIGRNAIIESRPKVKGTDTDGEINVPGLCLTFRDKEGEPLGTYLFVVDLVDRLQDVTIRGKTYKVTYRFKRTYKPYTVHLLEATHDVYPGTEKPKDYASLVRVDDPQLGEHGPIRIWMNHPMYYAGETFYQSGMYTDPETGVKTTTLQVVKNFAWTFPYLACSLVALGMIVHFLIRLITFQRSRRKLASVAAPRSVAATPKGEVVEPNGVWHKFGKFFPFAVVALAAIMLVGRAMTPSPRADRLDLYGFGQIPVQHGGRIQPADSLARNTHVVISGKQEFVDATNKDKTYSAIEWLLTVWAKPDEAGKFRIFRVDHPQILNLLGLPQRPGSYRYSPDELEPGREKLASQAMVASKKPKEQRDHYDERILQLAEHVRVYRDLEMRQVPGLLPADDPSGKWMSHADVVIKLAPDLLAAARAKAAQQVADEVQKDPDFIPMMVEKHVGGPREVQEADRQLGGRTGTVKWALKQETEERARPLARDEFLKALPVSFPAAGSMQKALDAFRANDVSAFNAAVAEYQEKHTAAISDSDNAKVRLEARMNHFDPFLQCAALYLVAGILVILSWLLWHQPLRRAAFGLACLTLVVHTGALLARMYIGNRPPVTNLYSSAVFIGWGGLVLCLILERFYKLGVGTLAGAVLGFSTMLIARFLAESGDTLEMLQAVLDTNFWLATHVTCVTMGYVATFVAGLIGIVYIIGGVFTSGLKGEQGKQVAGMMYGTICFAMLLSFTGTVLGGIWADQSWGRFWGWDPKENGAVLIVIWNALILHARWGGIIKPRGMAVLAVVGNMWTAWSWFGTNQLGIGLHAYGFDNRLATGCALFWVSQALIAGLGMIPLKYWASSAPIAPAKA